MNWKHALTIAAGIFLGHVLVETYKRARGA